MRVEACTLRMDARHEQALLRRAADSEAVWFISLEASQVRFQKVIEAQQVSSFLNDLSEAKQKLICEKQSDLQAKVAAAEEALRREKEAALELQTEAPAHSA